MNATLSAIAIDDNPSILKTLSKYAQKVDWLCFEKCFSKTAEAMDYLSGNSTDVVFIDIEMDDISGLDFIRMTRSRSLLQQPQFVIVSAHEQYALKGFDLDVTDYLYKPVFYDRFLLSIEKVRNRRAKSSGIDLTEHDKRVLSGVDSFSNGLFFQYNKKIIRLKPEEIIYVMSVGHYTQVYTTDKNRPYMLSYNITEMSQKLPSEVFIRIHKQYIVNIDFIREMDFTSVQLRDLASPIRVGATYRKKISEIFRKLHQG